MLLVFLLIALLATAETTVGEDISLGQQVSFAKELLPNLQNVAVITNINEKRDELKELIAAGKTLSVKFDIYDLPSVADVRDAFQLVNKSKPDLIWLLNDQVANHNFGRRLILERSLSSKIPVYSYSKDYLREGALFSVGKQPTGEVIVFFNNRIGGLIGVTVPAGFTQKVEGFPQ